MPNSKLLHLLAYIFFRNGRFKLRMHGIQVDNQLPFSPMPVLFRPQRMGDRLDYILKFSMTMQPNNSLDFSVYPYVGLQVYGLIFCRPA